MADWTAISSLATAGGTLILAVATFGSVRSANRSARIAELSLLAGLRPVLIPSREEDHPERVGFGDGVILTVPGHGAAVEVQNEVVYMAIALRNGGSGLAVLHGWRVAETEGAGTASAPDLALFRRQSRDLYIPAGDTGFWQGAIRDRGEDFDVVRRLVADRQRVVLDLLYGDHEGGQRAIARFGITQWPEIEGDRAEALRYWNVDRDDPR